MGEGKDKGKGTPYLTLEVPLLSREYSPRNFGQPFKKSHFLRKFSVWEYQNRLTGTIYIPTEISGFFGKW